MNGKSDILRRNEQRKEHIRRAQACISRHMDLNAMNEEILAVKMGICRKTLHEYREHPERLKAQTLWEMADILKCPVGELAGGDTPEEVIAKAIAKAIKTTR